MANALGQYWDLFYFWLVAPGRGEFIFNTLLRLAIITMLGLLILVLRKNRRAPTYEFRIGTMEDGLNRWEVIHHNELVFTHNDYKITADALYKLRPGFFTSIRWKLQNIIGGFLIVFKDETTEPIKYEKPKRTATTLLTVQESRALGLALKDEFRRALGGSTIFIIIAVVVVGVLIYYFYTGRIG